MEKWIRKYLNVQESSSAYVAFDKMEHQCGVTTPGVYRKYNPAIASDWINLINEMSYIKHYKNSDRVLDIGCGDGYPILSIAPYVKSITGIDHSKKRVEVSRNNALRLGIENASFSVMNGEELTFGDNCFDGVVSATAIEQAANPKKVFKEVYRVLKPGAVFVSAFQNLHFYLGNKGRNEVCTLEKYKNCYYYLYRIENKNPCYEKNYHCRLKQNSTVNNITGLYMKKNAGGDEITLNNSGKDEFGLPFLKKLKDSIDSCMYYKIQHFTPATLKDALTNTGFNRIEIEPNKARILYPVIKSIEKENLLATLKPYFEKLCRSFSNVKCSTPLSESHIIFVQARKPY